MFSLSTAAALTGSAGADLIKVRATGPTGTLRDPRLATGITP